MPVRRVRRRYLRFRVASEWRYQAQDVADAVQRGVLSLYGVHGLSRINPVFIGFEEEGQTGILRCSHLHLRLMRAALAYVTNIDGHVASIHVMRVSGTIKGLKPR